MKRIFALLFIVCAPLFISAQTSTLIISEIAEGSSNNKYLEIYNGTGVTVDLTLYSLSSCSNGCNVFNEFDYPDGFTFAPGATVANDSVYIIAHGSADPAILGVADETHNFLSNGDDVYALTLVGATATNYTIIDLVGDMQADPGSGWQVAGVTSATANHTLVRKYNICQGNPAELGSFGTDSLSSEWVVFPSNYWDSLDTHYNNCVISGCNTINSISPIACGTYTAPSGSIHTTTSNFLDTIPNNAGCDSIITVNLTINPIYNETAAATICIGNTYVFGTQTLTTGGQYTELFSSVNSCDSTVVLDLMVVTSFTTDTSAIICAGESYILGSQTLTMSGPYSELMTSTGGCDSTVNLILTVNPTSSSSITASACETYTSPSGKIWTISNSYNDTIPNTLGCDSVITIALTINQPTSSAMSQTVCGSYTLNSTTYTNSGVYTQIIPNAMMCDSTITLTLDITPIPNTPVASADSNYCEGDAMSDMWVQSTTTFDSLIISGVADATLSGGLPKYVEFYAIYDIADLSNYGFGSANNGGGTDGVEYTFPSMALTAGSFYTVATDSANFFTFYNYYPNSIDSWAGNVNGDDAIELFTNVATIPMVIDVFGDINIDGSGQPWEYMDGWAYRNTNAAPNGGIFNIGEWTFSGPNALDGASDNATSGNPVPVQTYSFTVPTSTFTWYTDAALTNMAGTGPTLAPGATTQTYYVTETFTASSTCPSTADMVTNTVNPIPVVTFGALTNICSNSTAITLSEGLPANGIYSGNGVTSPQFDPATAGIGTHTLTYMYSDANGCSASATSDIMVDDCSGLEDLFAATVQLFPNPANGQFALRFEQAKANVIIMDLKGNVISTYEVVSNQNIDVSSISTGTYLVQGTIDEHTFTKRLTVK